MPYPYFGYNPMPQPLFFGPPVFPVMPFWPAPSSRALVTHLFDHFTLNIPQRKTNKSGVCLERVYIFLLCVSLAVRVDT